LEDAVVKPERAIERAANRRVAMYVGELGWLDGFPLDEHSWHVLGTMTPIAIDGARIAKSRRAARSALREHRDSLAVIVGDVERWWSIVDAKLAWCSSRVSPLDLIDRMPPRAARSARALSPQLQPAIVAASIAWATRPAELGRVIAWLAAHPSVMTFGVARAIELAAMGLLDDGASAVLALLEIDAPDPVVAVQRLSVAEARIQAAGQKPSRKPRALEPATTTSSQVIDWFDRLVGQPLAIKRRSAQLVAALRGGAGSTTMPRVSSARSNSCRTGSMRRIFATWSASRRHSPRCAPPCRPSRSSSARR